ncbi:uncharacterized protein BCR38DRAFT_461424 [Pseudomassariella vexata]|uniref:COP9 signalosome complex subunit 3 N-terminal helical repeats domain-containing protein n=1 Tax=Pseudomassariella vexata TaxID=1141098 RepID=A0A1Y2DDD2_9PEZI|nr:uncharacterized protein BCR38DRAFT_461424 [Pseudomassariella vexata]ORY57292.1 hypothetical protein BCR38DRAFT_461424 [Pseudomassariella vexata]
MDQCAAVCLAFPPEDLLADNQTYHKAVGVHLTQLSKLLKESTTTLVTHGLQLLELMDPAVKSLSYLAVLHTLLIPSVSAPRDVVLEKLVVFLLSFDSRSLRYAGSHLLDILNLTPQLLPPSIAVQVLSEAILRIDPTGSMLTSTHTHLIKLAYTSNSIHPTLLQVIDKPIVFYPGMANQSDSDVVCDMSIPPPKYISKDSALTVVLKPAAVLEYDLTCGLIYCAQRDWAKAYAAFERVVTFPTREQGTSKIMVEAYKKWVLVSLLLKGKVTPTPSYTGPGANKVYETLGKQYTNIASLFESDGAQSLKEAVDADAALWREDGNMGLIREVLAAYQMWHVLNLRQVYTKISIPEIRQQTKSAQTGNILDKDEDIETLIQNMVASGMLDGITEKHDDGTKFLTFLPPSTALSEQQLAAELAQTATRLKNLQPVFKSTGERLGTSKEYVRHLVKDQRRGGDKDNDTMMGFDKQVDEEDLMGGITST